MKKIIPFLFATLILLIASCLIDLARTPVEKQTLETAIVLTPLQQWKQHLWFKLRAKGFTRQDYQVMNAIISCESSWGQYYKDGTVKVSSGNIGLAQINRLAHHEEYEKLGLDPYDPFQNLSFAVILYERKGINDWIKWSGKCFLPILEAKGLI